MPGLKRISNIIRYGVGAEARKRKQADKERVRQATFEDEQVWQRGDDMARRSYATYDDYVAHQSSKLDKILDRLHETEGEDLAEFRRRFEGCAALKDARNVLCLGARLGTEVRALIDLGHFALGIDLNPGKDNFLVLPGDFHNIVFADASVDAIYTNTLDHVFDLDKLMAEIRRLLRPGGIFVTDLLLGFDEEFVPGQYESMAWSDSDAMIEKVRATADFELVEVRDLGKTRRDSWRQAVMRKPAEA